MSILYAENYEYFGLGDVQDVMLDGLYAEIGSEFGVGYSDTETVVPAFEQNGKPWLMFNGRGSKWRRGLGNSFSAGIGFCTNAWLDSLPAENNRVYIARAKDGSNAVLWDITITTDGNIRFRDAAGTTLAETVTQPFKAQTIHKIQAQVTHDASTATVEVRLDDAVVIDADTLNITGSITQMDQGRSDSSFNSGVLWFTKFFVPYSLTGTYNDDWPSISGVATLWPDAITEEDNFTPRPYERFGIGVLDNRASTASCVDCGNSTDFDLSDADFTIEGNFRWTTLPTDTNQQVLFAKNNATGDERSYKLVKSGPNRNEGKLTWEVTEDGLLSGVENVFELVFDPVIGHYYHIAVVRDTGVTKLFIDGIEQGVGYADTRDYYAADAKFAVAGEITDTTTVSNGFPGMADEVRVTPGVARYTSNFTPPSEAFPRSVAGGDADFASVVLLCGFDDAIEDLSDYGRTLTARGGSALLTPDDGTYSYQTVDYFTPYDDRFLESPFNEATGVLTLDALPADTETVTLGATTYTFNTVLGAANSILIGADEAECLANLQNAINAGPGEGTTYGTGTTQNASASAALGPDTDYQLTAEALTAGTAGNSIASTETLSSGSWSAATLLGGVAIPDPVEYSIDPLPPEATGLRALFLIDRSFVQTDNASLQKSFVVAGDDADGADNALTGSPTYRGDVIEEDPDTTSALTPQSVLNGRIKLTRTS